MRSWHYFLTLLGVAVLLTLTPARTFAADFREGGSVSIPAGQTVNDDLYIFGGTLSIQGKVNGDVVTSGGTITVNGPVTGDLITAGGTVNVSSKVDGSVRAAGGTVTINGPVGQDVLFAGGTLNIGPNARVGRDLLIGSGSATVTGPITRNIRAGSGDLTLSGPVGGDVHANVGSLQLTSGAVVKGRLSYTSEQAAVVEPGAKVQSIQRQIPRDAGGPVNRTNNFVVPWLRRLVGLLLLGLGFVLVFPGFSRRTAGTLGGSPWASLGLGFALLLVVPIVALILFIVGLFIGGWWLAVIMLTAYATALLLGVVVAGLFLGGWVLGRAGWSRGHITLALLLGVVLLMLVGLVPYVGGLVFFLATLFGLGALALAFMHARREPAMTTAA